MSPWKISLKNILSKPIYTFLSVFVLALSITLLLGIQQLKSSFEYQMENNLGKIDLVIGAKGSPLQLVLASILHIDNPTGNISYSEAQEIGKSPMIKSTIPISYGDNYKGFRIVGTTNDFTSLYNADIEKGRIFSKTMEVVLGNSVAEQLNLKVGDTFLSSHGLIDNEIEVHNDELKVVGILKPTQKVIDRLIITNLESVWDVHEHEEEHHDDDDHSEHHHKEEHHHEETDDDKEITSLLVNFKNPRGLLTFPRKINKQTNMQAVLPKYELDRLYEFTGVGLNTISWIAYLILAISCIIIFISLYKTVKERSFDLALLRTYGASNFQIIKMMLYEGFIIVITAFLIGILFVKIGLSYIVNIAGFGFKQNIIKSISFEEIGQTGILVFIMTAFAILLAIYPILKMNISTILSNEK